MRPAGEGHPPRLRERRPAGGGVNVLRELTLELTADGLVSGSALVPEAAESHLPAGKVEISGRYAVAEGLVRFDLEPATALNEVTFFYNTYDGSMRSTAYMDPSEATLHRMSGQAP